MYNLNYTSTTLGVQSGTEITSGGTRTKKVEHNCYGGLGVFAHSQPGDWVEASLPNRNESYCPWDSHRTGLDTMEEANLCPCRKHSSGCTAIKHLACLVY
jgi:hypothetical protein